MTVTSLEQLGLSECLPVMDASKSTLLSQSLQHQARLLLYTILLGTVVTILLYHVTSLLQAPSLSFRLLPATLASQEPVSDQLSRAHLQPVSVEQLVSDHLQPVSVEQPVSDHLQPVSVEQPVSARPPVAARLPMSIKQPVSGIGYIMRMRI